MKPNKEESYELSKSFDQFHGLDGQSQEEQTPRAVALINQAIKAGTVPDKHSAVINAVLDDLTAQDQTEAKFKIGSYEAAEMDHLPDSEILRYLYHRYRYIVYPAIKKADAYPPCVQIEPTSICNYRCSFCYQSDKTFSGSQSGHMGMMSFDCFKKIVDQIEGNVEFVTMASRGEPLLAKDIIQMIKYTAGKFLNLKINTNASLLTAAHAHAILSSGVSTLVFSADASDKELYGKYRINGNFDKIIKNIETFRDIKLKQYPDSDIITRVSGVLIDPDNQNIDSMLNRWGDLVDQVSFVKYSPWEKIYQAEINDMTEPCSDLWRRMFIWHDGTVSPCDNDYKATLKVGSIYKNNISELWQSEEYKKLRQKHTSLQRGTLEPCKRCVVT